MIPSSQVFIVFVTMLLAPVWGFGQAIKEGNETAEKKWFLSISYGLQQEDVRLFNYVDRELFDDQSTSPATVIAASAGRRLIRKGRFSYQVGIGLQYFKDNFNRPFDHSMFSNSDNFRIFRFLDSDSRLDLIFTNQVEYHFKRLSLSMVLQLNNQLSRAIRNPRGGDTYPYRDSRFMARSLAISPCLSYYVGRFSLATQVRAIHISRNDKVIFGPWIKDQAFEAKQLDWNNTLRVQANVNYWF